MTDHTRAAKASAQPTDVSVFWMAVALAAFCGFVFTHWPITAFCDALVQRVGFGTYQVAVGGAFLIGGLATMVALGRRRGDTSTHTTTFIAGLFALVALAQPSVILINIENVHFPQYALLALLFARGGLGPLGAWLVATGLGALDEAYQFMFLTAGRPDRLDWNDISFNAIGAAFGVAFLLHYGALRAHPPRHSTLMLAVWLTPLAAAALLAAPPVFSPFYSVTPHGLRSHELTAGEGLVVLCGLMIALHDLVTRLSRHPRAADATPGGRMQNSSDGCRGGSSLRGV